MSDANLNPNPKKTYLDGEEGRLGITLDQGDIVEQNGTRCCDRQPSPIKKISPTRTQRTRISDDTPQENEHRHTNGHTRLDFGGDLNLFLVVANRGVGYDKESRLPYKYTQKPLRAFLFQPPSLLG